MDEVANLVRSQSASIFGNVFVVFPVAYLLGLALAGRARDPGRRGQGGEDRRFALDPRAVGALRGLHGRAAVVLERAGGLGGQLVPLPAARARPSRRTGGSPTRSAPRRCSAWPDSSTARSRASPPTSRSGFMLGSVPVFFAFYGLPVEVRHVTLSTGQLAATVVVLGWGDRWRARPSGSPSRASPLIGVLNVGVSFALALHVAIRARDDERRRPRRRLRRHPAPHDPRARLLPLPEGRKARVRHRGV